MEQVRLRSALSSLETCANFLAQAHASGLRHRDLHLRHAEQLPMALARAIHQANALTSAAAQGIQYKPSRRRVSTSSR